MWLPLRLALEYVGRSAAWLSVMTALGVAAALLITLAARRPWRSAWPRFMVAGLVGALLGASVADRFDLPEALIFLVWRRAVPLAWSAGGALLGGAVAWAVARRRSHRAGAQPPLPLHPVEAEEPDQD